MRQKCQVVIKTLSPVSRVAHSQGASTICTLKYWFHKHQKEGEHEFSVIAINGYIAGGKMCEVTF